MYGVIIATKMETISSILKLVYQETLDVNEIMI